MRQVGANVAELLVILRYMYILRFRVLGDQGSSCIVHILSEYQYKCS